MQILPLRETGKTPFFGNKKTHQKDGLNYLKQTGIISPLAKQ